MVDIIMSENNSVELRERPLSPHLSIYKPQITSVMSIMHRITGIFLLLGLFLDVAFIFALVCGEESFNSMVAFINSFFGKLIMTGFIFSLYYHLCNGIRHMFWDMGKGINIPCVKKSGILVFAISITASIATLISFYS